LTEADREKDIRSLRRCTQSFLYLALRSSSGGSWHFPTAAVADGESLRAAALRAMQDTVGTSIEAFIFGNAPAGHVEQDGERTFFMLGAVLDGNAALQKGGSALDFAWLTRAELLAEHDGDPDTQRVITTVLAE
jgi:ADP-ribose pyrophosphatase YjhB (NUDIX family)